MAALTQYEQLSEKVLSLQQALLGKHPTMPTLLSEIWKICKTQPDNVTLMTEEEIAIVVSGLETQTGVQLAATTVKGSKSAANTKAIQSRLATLGVDAV